MTLFSAPFLNALVIGGVILAGIGAIILLTLLIRDVLRRSLW